MLQLFTKVKYLQKVIMMPSWKAWVQRTSGRIKIERKHKRLEWRWKNSFD